MMVFGHPPQSAKERLLETAASLNDELPDRYGEGELLERLERRIAELLGKEAAVFMPSGVMAQQAALRVHAGRSGLRTVALHPRSHLYESEADAFERLHELIGIPLGSRNAMFTIEDLRAVAEPIGTLLLELPDRNLGGPLRDWNALTALVACARERGARVHLDGARLWECGPFYGRPYAEIAGLFDTVYVSMYKIINAVAGAVLAGPADIIAEARTWQLRHGGRLIMQFPMAVSAWNGLDKYLPRVPRYVARAREIAKILRECTGVRVVPEVPPTNMMHVYVAGDYERLVVSTAAVAEEMDFTFTRSWQRTAVPGWSLCEIHCGEGSLAIDDNVLRQACTRIFENRFRGK